MIQSKRNVEVIMDGTCNMHYSAFYVYGLVQMFPNSTKFRERFFEELGSTSRCFRFIVRIDAREYKFAIDYHDSRDFDFEVLKWSDVYGKINLNLQVIEQDELLYSSLGEHLKKVYSVAPSFGIRAFGLFGTCKHIISMLGNVRSHNFSSVMTRVLNVIRMHVKRVPLENYKRSITKEGYVFLVASIWHESTAFINISRANFIKACMKESNITFEGGLVDVGYSCDYIENLDLYKLGNRKIRLTDYLAKLRKSIFVFNGPSVLYCHGWKLGEYLCMGKAILSTPLSNDLPYPLEHGKNIHFVEDNYESIAAGIRLLRANPSYIAKLENGALEYWNQFGSPESVISSLLGKGGLLFN